jgi:glutathione synthase/RimK-type ligase-like ATP-grasp enzyme
MTVLLATCAAMPGLTRDDRYLLHALAQRGVEAEPAVWEDPHREWAAADLVLIRTAWDYSYRRDQFLEWSERVAEKTHLWNPAPLVRWNTHKRYLCELAEAGVPTVPTALLPAGSAARLDALLGEFRWEDAVIKAAVAQTGRYAMRAGPADVARGQAHLDRLLPHEDMLIQPYVESVERSGEVSLVYVDGEFTHAVRKRAASGEFMVHHDYGGTERATRPTSEESRVAGQALATLTERALYARVDLVAGADGAPLVMELELVEPELFFRYSQAAVEHLVDAVVREAGAER